MGEAPIDYQSPSVLNPTQDIPSWSKPGVEKDEGTTKNYVRRACWWSTGSWDHTYQDDH